MSLRLRKRPARSRRAAAPGRGRGSGADAAAPADRRRDFRDEMTALVESSEDFIVSRAMDGTILTWNPAAERLSGYTAAEAIGRDVRMVYAPEQMAEILEKRKLGLTQFEMDVVKKDGGRLPCSVSTSFVLGEDGKPRAVCIIARDISGRRSAEAALRRSEEQLRQAQKMEAIGSLAGGVAHDFNNLLSVILSYVSMVIDDLEPSASAREDLLEVQKAAVRATTLTRQLLAFSRRQVLRPRVVDLVAILGGVEKMLGRLLGEDVTLSLLTAQPVDAVLADPGQLEQVVMNLVVNARDAMPRGGALTIEACNVTLDAQYAATHHGVRPGPHVMLAVSDTGIGMDRATLDRIFEPFFTTKEVGKGTGLGLSTVYGIVQQSAGHLSVYSEPGQGTTFKLYFPSTDRAPEAARPTGRVGAHRQGAETILLVEDDDQVRAIERAVLRRNGYTVLEAQNGGEAFLVCESFGGAIHLLLTDVVMPRMSGRELAERLARLRPEMKVLYASGYTPDAVVQHGVLDAGVPFLEKPITPDALLDKVREVLDSPPRVARSPAAPPA